MYVQGKGHTHWGPGTSMVQFTSPSYSAGMGACCTQCADGGKCMGLGLFDSGFLNIAEWGWQEVLVVAIGGYMLVSTIFSTKRAAGRIAAIPGNRRKRRAAKYRSMADEIEGKGKGRKAVRKAA